MVILSIIRHPGFSLPMLNTKIKNKCFAPLSSVAAQIKQECNPSFMFDFDQWNSFSLLKLCRRTKSLKAPLTESFVSSIQICHFSCLLYKLRLIRLEWITMFTIIHNLILINNLGTMSILCIRWDPFVGVTLPLNNMSNYSRWRFFQEIRLNWV